MDYWGVLAVIGAVACAVISSNFANRVPFERWVKLGKYYDAKGEDEGIVPLVAKFATTTGRMGYVQERTGYVQLVLLTAILWRVW